MGGNVESDASLVSRGVVFPNMIKSPESNNVLFLHVVWMVEVKYLEDGFLC